ncbi:MAG: hypothetical protein AAGD33_07535 [Actinomycetota bacterium]
MRPPICDVCDADVDPVAEGALITFVADDASRARRRRADREHLVGHTPDTGWFCADHVDAARDLAASSTYSEALDALRATSGTPDPPAVPDVGTGRFVRSERSEQSWFEWDLPPTDARAVADRLVDALDDLHSVLGLHSVSELDRRTARHWTPMDRVGPPHCPYDDTTTDEGTAFDGEGRRVRVVVEVQVVHWSDDDVNAATVDLSIGGPWPDEPGVRPLVGVSAFGSSGGGRDVTRLRLRGRRRERVIHLVEGVVERLRSPT